VYAVPPSGPLCRPPFFPAAHNPALDINISLCADPPLLFLRYALSLSVPTKKYELQFTNILTFFLSLYHYFFSFYRHH